MAVNHLIFCATCQQTKHIFCGAGDSPTECDECASNRIASERAAHLAALAAFPLEDRIAKIEAWIYDYKVLPSPSDMRF